MSSQDRKDFDDRLAELSNWQIEQQKKLKAFQETQRRLLDLEHQNILNGLRTHNFDQKNEKNDEGIFNNSSEKYDTGNGWDFQPLKNKETSEIFQLKYPSIRLHGPDSSSLNIKSSLSQDNKEDFFSESIENLQETESCRPKKFLRRGEGLARFRMTLDDFRGLPKIYREKRIKTYLNGKPESVCKKTNNKNINSSRNCNRGNKNSQPKMPNKSAPLPVKIYVPENISKKCNVIKKSDSKQSKFCKKDSDLNLPKTPIQELALRPCSIATEWYNIMKEKEKEKADNRNEIHKEKENYMETVDLDREKKKDEKELQIFEILEKKVDESSFCSTSSFVDKLIEQSLSSTPSKPYTNDLHKMSYTQGLKSLRSQFLEDEQIKKFEGLGDIPLELILDDSEPENLEPFENKSEKENDIIIEEMPFKKKENELDKEIEVILPLKNEPKENKTEYSQPHQANKTLLQEYIRDFKKLKSLVAENDHEIEPFEKEELPSKDKPKQEVQINQKEIALKLQRKGLQDNVKQILNWECPPRKKLPRKLVKKTRPKVTKTEKLKVVDKEQNEKIVISSGLLKTRLEELEKEIEIFRKENKILERLQKECNEERVKLAKEKKEFEKHMQEEKEKLETKMTEEQKKLQKEKAVFEKYYKQVKNQPTRREREELTNLKKELEKVTETLTTKETRWGASQARLRNQIKNLEKEISQLKEENEKYKKLSMKKVSFQNERNLNTKIIHAINSELGKLKPTVIKNVNSGTKNPSLSARVEKTFVEKPIRRIKSAPNMKKQAEAEVCSEVLNEYDEKALGSISTDSGIETNGSRYARLPRSNDISGNISDSSKNKNSITRPQKETSRSPLFELFNDCSTEKKSAESDMNDHIESAVHEALFGTEQIKHNSKISDIKNRLERLSLYNCSEENSESFSERTIKTPKETLCSFHNSDSEEVSGSSAGEEEDESETEIIDFYERKGTQNKNDSSGNFLYERNSLLESKIDDNGIRERIFEDGTKEITYPNGNVKKILPGYKIVKMAYYNGDIKETNVVEGSEKYYYAETKTWHTTYKDGLEVLEFPNGQTERRHADGSTEISFPNGCVRYCDSSGKDEWRFLDGTVIKTNESGHKILLLPNGQKEIHTKEFKRREYPDGTVKILYADGTQETRYATGRVRLKDKEGNLLMDSGGIR